MRAYLFLLLVSASGERLLAPRQVHANCRLATLAPPSLQDIPIARPAIRAFAHQIDSPYTVLYLQAAPDKRQPSFWVLIVQHSATHFTRYAYQGQRVDSSQVVVSTWQPLLAQLGRGSYATECESVSTAPTMSRLLGKQGPKLTYSLQLTNYHVLDFTAADRARMASALALMQRFIK